MKTLSLKDLEIPTSGLRESSFAYLRAGRKAYGGPPNIGIEHGGRVVIYDGRHRMLIAREEQRPIEIVVRYYGPRGGLLKTERRLALL